MKCHYIALATFILLLLGCNGNFLPGRIVEYQDPLYTIDIDTTTGGTAIIDPMKSAFTEGEQIKLTAYPSVGYAFTKWTGTIDTAENPYIIKVIKDERIIPHFEKTITYNLLTEWSPIGGTIISSTGNKTIFQDGERCFIMATPADGYVFDRWEGDIVTTNDTVYITFTKDFQVYPRFSKIPTVITYTLTATATNGSIQRIPSKESYYVDEIVRITAVPDSGYLFDEWDGAYVSEPIVFDIIMDGNKSISTSFLKRKWSVVVYMAAENDLEPAAIADFNELEGVDYHGKPISILVLFDRIAGYDSTNDDWTDTRLFEIKQDPGGVNATIISERIDCPDLGLVRNVNTDLNTADPLVLSRLIDFTKRVYSAENYALIIWGHGTGWRGSGFVEEKVPEPLKAVAFDDTTGNFMTLPSLGSAIAGKGISVIGFDTCFGALIEIAYQIRNDAGWLVASEGIIPSTGWNYSTLFTSFLSNPTLSASVFCDSVISQFSSQYSGTQWATISKIDLSKINSLFSAFDSFAQILAQSITTSSSRDAVRDAILDSVDRYHFTSFPSDLYIDLYSFSEVMVNMRTTITSNTTSQTTISQRGSALQSALNTAVVSSWSKTYGTTRKNFGVYVIPLIGDKTPAASHHIGYIKGSLDMGKSAFVDNSNYWVPNTTPNANSFLDKIFYWSF